MERTGTSRSCPSGPARQVAGRHVVGQPDAFGGLVEGVAGRAHGRGVHRQGMGQVLAGSDLLTPTGPIAEGAGVLMIVMAFVVAYRARAPLVCRLPLPSTLQRSSRLGILGPFVSGFAIATGCLACFGAAILGVLLVYAGLLGSPLLGGLAMLTFSLGLAVPFLLAALGLSWTLPLALKLQRATPAIGLLSAAAMLFFGVSMATGNFHVVSGWLYQHLPLA